MTKFEEMKENINDLTKKFYEQTGEISNVKNDTSEMEERLEKLENQEN